MKPRDSSEQKAASHSMNEELNKFSDRLDIEWNASRLTEFPANDP